MGNKDKGVVWVWGSCDRCFKCYIFEQRESHQRMFSGEERIEISVTAREKRLLQRAMTLSGEQDLNLFLVNVLKQHAQDLIARQEQLCLGPMDSKVFFEAVFGSSEPNKVLQAAASRYKKRISPE